MRHLRQKRRPPRQTSPSLQVVRSVRPLRVSRGPRTKEGVPLLVDVPRLRLPGRGPLPAAADALRAVLRLDRDTLHASAVRHARPDRGARQNGRRGVRLGAFAVRVRDREQQPHGRVRLCLRREGKLRPRRRGGTGVGAGGGQRERQQRQRRRLPAVRAGLALRWRGRGDAPLCHLRQGGRGGERLVHRHRRGALQPDVRRVQ
mmetsp:Transcript_43367/g.85211  ORF Transcript_43367/g.85211 Transcript_43367/m.85211 type:complete len:203 (-) Transcript_43367:189-797(-)